MKYTEAVKEQMLQGNLFEKVTKFYKHYNVLLSVDEQDQDEDWFNDIYVNIAKFKLKIHGWLRDNEREIDVVIESKRSIAS